MIRELLKTFRLLGKEYKTYHAFIQIRYTSNYNYDIGSYCSKAYLPSGYEIKKLTGYSTQEEALKAIEDWIERNTKI